MDSIISTFHIDWKIIVAQVINFAVVFLVLYYFAFKPLRKMMDERNSEITKGLSDAKMNAEMLVSTQTDYEAKLAEARKQANKLVSDMKKEVTKEREDLLTKANEDAKTVLARGKEDLEAEKAKMIEQAKNELADLVLNATKKVLGNAVTESIDKKLIEKSLEK